MPSVLETHQKKPTRWVKGATKICIQKPLYPARLCTVYMLVQEWSLFTEKQELCQILCRCQLKSENSQGTTHSTLISSVSASVTITASTGLLPQPLTLSCRCKAGKKDGTFLQSHKVNFCTDTFRLHVRYKKLYCVLEIPQGLRLHSLFLYFYFSICHIYS